MLNRIHMLINRFGLIGSYIDEAKPSKRIDYYQKTGIESLIQNPYAFKQTSEELCEKALIDAKTQLHPLLRQVEMEKLGQRREFVEAFKHALEKVVAERIALWLPCVKLVYKFDPPRGTSAERWDNMIHLLLLVPRILPGINEFGAKLDSEMLKRLKSLHWSRFQDSKSIIEIQQVTRNEIRHGVCYGAMFYSFYTAPSQVWPPILDQPN